MLNYYTLFYKNYKLNKYKLFNFLTFYILIFNFIYIINNYY